VNRVFICYSHKDKRFLEQLQVHLKPLQREGTIDVWDDTRIMAGEDWRAEIRLAVESAKVAVLLISADFLASDFIATDELPPLLLRAEWKGTTILPIIVGPCRFQETKALSRFQAVNNPSKPLRGLSPFERDKIFLELSQRIEFLQQEPQEQQDIDWEVGTISESSNEQRGYELKLQHFRFTSSKYPQVSDMSDYIKAKMIEILFHHRMALIHEDLLLVSKSEHLPASLGVSFNAHCSSPVIIGDVISIQYTNWWFVRDAAHPNHYFTTFNFSLKPLTLIPSLMYVFTSESDAFRMLQAEIRKPLYEFNHYDDLSKITYTLDRNWIDQGTSSWSDFANFNFTHQGIEVLFAPYQIQGYAYGSHIAPIPYSLIVPFMRPEYIKLLGLDGLVP
jgi:hypothetical protein